MLHSNLSVLTSLGWKKMKEIESLVYSSIPFEIATIVNNDLLYSQIKEFNIKTSKNWIEFYDSNENIFTKLSEEQKVCYRNEENGKIQFSPTAKDLIDKEIFLPRSIFVPDDLDIDPHLQECISTLGLMAIIYTYGVELNNSYVILMGHDRQDVYLQDLTTHAGFLRLTIEDYDDGQILLNINDIIHNLCPLVKYSHGKTKQLITTIPQWFFNVHPYGQREFLRLLLKYSEHEFELGRSNNVFYDAHRTKSNYFPECHLDKIHALGIQCGMPIFGSHIGNIKKSNNDLLKVSSCESKHEDYGFEIHIEPTNIICVKSSSNSFITYGK